MKPISNLDENRPIQSAGADMIQWIASLEIVLPKLSPMTLQSLAFDHFDKSLKNGEPTAAKIAAGIMNLTDLEQRDAAARRSEWSRSRCVEFLRSEAARLNVELFEMAQRTKSEAVKVAVIDTIYAAIIASYPHLKTEAADMAVRKKLELARNGQRSATVMSHTSPEHVAPAIVPEPPKTTITLAEAQAQAAADAEGDLNQIGHAQVAALKMVHQFVIPAAAQQGITVDATQASGLVMNAIIQLFHQRSHFKFSRTRSEAQN